MTPDTITIVDELIRRASGRDRLRDMHELAKDMNLPLETIRRHLVEGKIEAVIHEGKVLRFHLPTVEKAYGIKR